MITLRCGAAIEVGRLRAMTTAQLRKRYTELFEVTPRTNNRSYLFSRLALRVQQPGDKALEKGKAESTTPAPLARVRDTRLPGVGSIITKIHRGHEVKVLVQADGFVHDGTRYRSLSAIARKLMGGTSINGYGFFGLATEKAS